LGGASLGGLLAVDYAIRRNARVRRLALLAPGGIGRLRMGFVLRAAPLLLLGPWGHRRALDLDMGFSESDLRGENQDFLKLFTTVQSGFAARMQPLPRFPDAALGTLTMPILAVVGGKDSVFDSGDTRRRLSMCTPHAQVLFLPDAGHGLQDMTAEIRRFLVQGA
jgi:pimeloyl-ACP methyl ester carboxylesterase